jgi:fructokinase
MAHSVLCVGEVLWDALPMGLFLGGAPFNVSCHLHQLGETVTMASRVGDDVLGHEVIRRIRHRGMRDDHIQLDSDFQTGFVEVALDTEGTPDYTIVEPVAWDEIELTEALHAEADRAEAIVFGSLAQRRSPSRETIQALWAADARAVFDVNLRPPFVDRAIVEPSLQAADIVKMNDEELEQMIEWFDIAPSPRAAMEALTHRFDIALMCVTRGPRGAVLWNDGHWGEHPGYSVAVADTVGAGDAFLAALLAGYLAGRDDATILDEAARLGAYVATQMGPTPSYDGLNALPALDRNRGEADPASSAASGGH